VELITNIIIEYLKHNKRLCVPKLGTFIVKQSSGDIIFSDLMRNDDGVLRLLLMAYGIKELEANGKIDRYVFEVHHAITTDGKFMVEGFGEFSANINNSITFTQVKREKRYGGHIKPPVEVLERRKAQQKMQRPRPENRLNEPERPKHNKTKVQKREDTSSNKPDKYLRGLKYDSNKNKKREESSRSRGHGRNSNRGLILLCLLIIGGAAALVWYQRKPSTTVTDTVATPAPKVSPAIMCDTTLLAEPPIDTLMESLPLIVTPTTTFKKSITE
jgi:nucleoid DNA-binding protein